MKHIQRNVTEQWWGIVQISKQEYCTINIDRVEGISLSINTSKFKNFWVASDICNFQDVG
jgi:hypothetical protein